MKKIITSLFSLITLLVNTQLYAQQNGNGNGKVSLLFEKVYLHTDRDLYASGEDIWFKAYLVNARNNYLTNNSSNLYVELISPDNEIIDREVIRLNAGVGNGDFKLKDSIPEGKYQIRAYTKWMLNFGDLFVYNREIQIHSLSKLKPKKQGEKETEATSISFMPEGGSLIDSVESILAFKASNEKGNGCKVKGAILNAKGDTINWFEDQYQGMGQIQFLPEPGQTYFATGTLDGKAFKKQLPKAMPKGYVLNITKADTLFVVRILTNRLTLSENAANDLILQGQSFGKPCYGAKFKISKLRTTVAVPQSAFQPGIAVFTLYETQPATRPFCERLIFLDGKGKNKQAIAITTNKPNYGIRDSITIKIKTTNQLNQPVKANVSVSVVDADQIPSSEHSIASYLYLESELKGKIENAAAYFDPTNSKRAYMLDMLLLTQGWRDFLWKQLADTLPKIKVKYLMEQNGFYVTGRVKEILRDKPVSESNLTLSVAGAKKNGLQILKTDSLGKFFFDLGVEFYGTKPLKITSKKFNKLSGFLRYAGEVIVDSLWVESPFVTYKIPFLPQLTESKFTNEAQSRNLLMRKYKLSDTIQLNEMTINAKTTKADEQMGMFLVNGAMPDMDFKLTEEDASYSDFGMYILSKIPQAEYVSTTEGQRIRIKGVTGTMVKPRFILDNRSSIDTTMIEEEIYSLMMDQIDRILISKQDLINGDLDRYVIAVYTKPGALEKKNFSVLSISARGYYESRVFYSPNYSIEKTARPDLRTTIFWAPNVTTNENGEATIRFYNNDKKTQVRIAAEGISSTGTPLTGSTSYKVQ
jgi:hypothetical protein